MSLIRHQGTASPISARGLGARLIAAALAVAVLAVACAKDGDGEPSGRIVVFGSPGGGSGRGWEVGLIPAAGGKVQRLTIVDDEFWDVAFSADGSQVAFNPAPGSDPRGITVMTLKDRRTTVVPNQPSQDRFGSYDLAWAPDARSLAFVNGDRIFTISIDGSDLREVARGVFPTWTTDGEHIVFASGLYRGPDLDVAVIRVDGTGLRFLGRGLYPDVSPSGDEVAYSTPVGVFVQPLDGGARRLVVRDGFGPVWSPDGRFLAFTRYTDCSGGHGPCSGRVFVVPVKGGEPRPIGPTVGDPRAPEDWIR